MGKVQENGMSVIGYRSQRKVKKPSGVGHLYTDDMHTDDCLGNGECTDDCLGKYCGRDWLGWGYCKVL